MNHNKSEPHQQFMPQYSLLRAAWRSLRATVYDTYYKVMNIAGRDEAN